MPHPIALPFPVALPFFAFLAGLVDAVVGGGGLIQLPALLLLLPASLPVATVLGTNKAVSIAGTGVAACRYAGRVSLRGQSLPLTTLAAFVCSLAGARAVTVLRPDTLRPLILLLLVSAFVYTLARKDFGGLHAPRLLGARQAWAGAALGATLGFYDGFFGPGTGSLLIFAFVGVFGFSFLSASASAKAVNFATNLSAVLFFAWTRHVLWAVALPMAACNVLGALAGTHLAVTRGSRFVRALFLCVVSALIARLGYDLWKRP